MSIRKTVIVLSVLLLAFLEAGAQNSFTTDRYHEKGKGMSTKPVTKGMIIEKSAGSPIDANPTLPYGYREYQDEKFDQLDKTMKDRQWGSEDTAWIRASELDTRQAYETYISRFPQGAHVAEANCRMIDRKVEETLANAHDQLPNIKCVEPDEFSPTTTLSIKNNTGYPLTVYCSGTDKTSVVIPVNGTRNVTITNGDYKLAASVPPAYIRPFAGVTTFYGGRYEMGFWVVSSYE